MTITASTAVHASLPRSHEHSGIVGAPHTCNRLRATLHTQRAVSHEEICVCAHSERAERARGPSFPHMASLPVEDLADSFAEATARPTAMPVIENKVTPKEPPVLVIEEALRDIRGLQLQSSPSPLPEEPPWWLGPAPPPSTLAPHSSPSSSSNTQGAAPESQSGGDSAMMPALLIGFVILGAIGLFCCLCRKKGALTRQPRARTISVGSFREHEMWKSNHFDNPWELNEAARSAGRDY